MFIEVNYMKTHSAIDNVHVNYNMNTCVFSIFMHNGYLVVDNSRLVKEGMLS